jgi:hypothetical protein
MVRPRPGPSTVVDFARWSSPKSLEALENPPTLASKAMAEIVSET